MQPDAALLKLTAKRDAMTLMRGHHFTSRYGEGYDFAELRAYRSGDDVRKIAWNVTAKTGELYVKELHDTRRLNVAVAALLDGSVYCAQDNAKQHLTARVALTLGYAALLGGERFMGIALTPKETLLVPPSQEWGEAERLGEYIARASLLHTALDIPDALARLDAALLEPSLLIVLYDFLEPCDLSLLAQRHDIVAIKIRCHAEAYGGFEGEKEVHNPKTGARFRRYLGRATRRAYLSRLHTHDEALHAHFYANRIRFTHITPEDNVVMRLMEAFGG